MPLPTMDADVIRFQIDLRVSACGFLARVLWFQGLADQAMRAAETSVAEALATGHALSLSHALAMRPARSRCG